MKKHSSAKFVRRNYPALPVYGHLRETPSGERRHHRSILGQPVSISRVLPRCPCTELFTSTVAPNTSSYPGDFDQPLRHDAGPPEEVPMTGLQIALAREIGGWPLYTIIIAAGQVRVITYLSSSRLLLTPTVDVECH